MPDRWHHGLMARQRADMIAIAGMDGSSSVGFNFNGSFRSDGAAFWLRTLRVSDVVTPTHPDAGIAEVEQQEPLRVKITQNSWPPTLYGLNGGKFRIRVQNYGTVSLQNIQINIRFPNNLPSRVCYSVSSKKRRYSNLNLLPGASVWLDFGDIEVPGQAQLPIQLCFWTSSPNQIPDERHENDRFCTAYTVPYKEPLKEPFFSIAPNPSDAGFLLVSPRSDLIAFRLDIYDLSGRLVYQQTLREQQQFIDTQHWPNGYYWLKVGQWMQKLIVAR